FERGIFATIYVNLEQAMKQAEAQKVYESFYAEKPFIQVVKPDDELELKTVVGTNNLQIHIAAAPEQKLLVITATLDNLIKGASGQAVQNFNLMYGFDETTGLQ